MQTISRRLVLPSIFAAIPLSQGKKPVQPPADLVIDSGDYPNLQAAHDAAFGSPANPHGTADVNRNIELRIRGGNHLPPFSGAPTMDTRYLHGGRIVGSGRFVTKLIQNVAGVPVIRTNGCAYSHFEGMFLEHQVGVPGTCFDLNWDGTAGGAALQSNTFADMEFYGGSYGIQIGAGGFMGSENLFQNCFWLLNSTAGLYNANYNALQQTIIGGNFQTCGIGVWAGVGSVPVIHGVGFQQQSVCDIRTEGNPGNAMSVVGCRSESANFIDNNGGHRLKVDACTQTSPNLPGFFVRQVGGQAVISASKSSTGNIIAAYWAQVRVENSSFDREDWLDTPQFWNTSLGNSISGCIELENVLIGGAPPFVEIRRQRKVYLGGPDLTTYEYMVTPL